MVTFYALAEGTRFDAQLMTANVNTLFLDPVAIIPLTTSIQSDRLSRRQSAIGIYVFTDALTPYLPMTFTYAATATILWNRIVRRTCCGSVTGFSPAPSRIKAAEGAAGKAQPVLLLPDTSCRFSLSRP